MMSTIQTPKEIKEKGIILKSYYKVLILGLISLLTFSLISSPIQAKGLSLFHFNESLCSCSAGGSGSSFNYADWFNQPLNTTSNVTFNSIFLNRNWNSIWTNSTLELSDKNTNNYIDINNDNGITVFHTAKIGPSTSEIDLYDSSLYMFFNDVNYFGFYIDNRGYTFDSLSGSGSAFACLNENGTLYRSNVSCI